MTRFARASGSKASNQRVPEDSTPWFVLKQQVTDNEQNTEETQENETDWKNVIDSEKKIEENKNSVWCEFEEEKPKTKSRKSVNKSQTTPSKKLGKHKSEESEPVSNSLNKKEKKKPKLSCENLNSANDSMKSDLKNIKSKLKLSNNKSTFEVEEFSPIKTEELSVKNGSTTSLKVEKFNDSSDYCNDDSKNKSVPVESIRTIKKKKNKRKFSGSQDINQSEFSESQSPISNKAEESNQATDTNEKEELSGGKLAIDDGSYKKNKKAMKKNNTITWQKQNKEESPYKRRKLDKGDVKLEINGLEIWVTRLDGFYIKKEDAERIKELEKDLLKRGVSNQEVRAVIKKERRNAEKSLARLKKKVCYHCRKGGHTLSSCPMLEDNGAQVVGSGICYKCGSTEHTHYQCKVNTGNSYKFATCFVCKQEGHISKQCPDNPRGVYPSGGGCRLCGDVTHFRRECPTLQAKSNKVSVGLINQDIETLDDQSNVPVAKAPANPRKNKIVKFS
ncbi:transcriptional regulator ATRX homolog [Halyomorpha halys]|uniref:transcriptional regulator ATRX homolog n=1 Tax=Halyomorpha halys TaxID=286706 RepID=UPI0006D4C7FB|nr:transcriptional regulator ATRX homolog [Halyomorpha halys]